MVAEHQQSPRCETRHGHRWPFTCVYPCLVHEEEIPPSGVQPIPGIDPSYLFSDLQQGGKYFGLQTTKCRTGLRAGDRHQGALLAVFFVFSVSVDGGPVECIGRCGVE